MFTVTIFFICILISTVCLRVIPFVRYATLLACLKVRLTVLASVFTIRKHHEFITLSSGNYNRYSSGDFMFVPRILYPAFSLRLAERCIEDFEIETFPMTILTVYTFSTLSLAAIHSLGLVPILNG